MLKLLPSAVIIFVILCFACVLNAVEDNVASNNGNSPKDSSVVVSPASSSKHSRRRIRPSAWSKEEKGHLNPNDDENKEQDMQLLDEETNLWNMKKLFRYVSSLFYDVNQTSDDSMDKSIDDLKIMMQSLTNNYPLDKSENNGKAEKKNSANSDTLDKSLDDAKIHNRSNNRQLVENSKIKSQNSLDKDSMDKPKSSMKTQMQNSTNTDIQNKSEDDTEMRNTANNNTLNKSLNNGKVQNSSNKDFPDDNQSTGDSKSKIANSTDKDSTDKLENNKKTETQNHESPDTLNKSANDEDIQNSAANNTLNKSSDNSKMQESSNRNSSDPTQLKENSKNNQQNSINKDHLNKSTQGTKIQNPSNNDIQLESISALKGDNSKDVTKIAFKDYEDCDTDKMKLDDCTTNNTPEEEVSEQADDNDDEEEDEDDGVENDMDETANEEEDEDDAVENDIDDAANEEEDEDDAVENDMDEDANEDDYINDTNNAKDTNENGVQDDHHVKENNYGDVGKLDTVNPNAQITIGKKAHNNSIILPKFNIQAIRDKQNHSETQPPTFDSNDNITLDGTKSQKIPGQGKPSPEFQLSSGEFIDDYINNPQRKTPERENKQPSNTGALIPNENAAKSKIIPIQIPVFKNNFEEDNRSLYAAPSVKENVKDRNMSFDQSQNNGDNLLSENNARTSPNFNENRKDSNPNKGFPDATFPQNVKNAPSSVDKPVFSAHEDENVNQFIPLNLFPFKQKSHSNDVQDTSSVPREDYNVFTKPAALDFQNINFPVKTPHNDIPATNIYKPEVIFPNKPIPLENERYLNDQYDNYNFQDKISPGLSNVKAQQFEENQPIISQQDIFPNNQYISKQGTPNTPDETTYFTNYKPETPSNIPNINRPIQNTEMFPKYFISDPLQSDPSFSEMYNQDSSPKDIGNNMDKIMSQDYSDAAKLQNQINNDNTLNLQSDNLPFQDNFPEQRIQFLQSDIKNSLPQSEMNNNAVPYESKMSSEVISAQDKSKTVEFPQTQNSSHNSKGFPHHSFSNTENVQIKPNNKDLSPVISENMEAKSPAKSSQPLIEERQKNRNFDESGGQEQRASNSDSDSNNNGRSDETSRLNYGGEYYEDKSEETTTLFKETDSDKNEVEDDFVSEHNYDFDDSTNEDDNEDDYEDKDDEDDYEDEDDKDDYTDEDDKDDYTDEDDEDNYADEDDEDDYADEDNENDYSDDNDEDHYADEDDYVYKNNYDDDETKADNRAQKSKTDQNNIEDIIPKAAKSHNIKSDKNSSQGSELINDDYLNNRLRKKSIKENWPMNPSDEMINDATMQITQNATSGDTNDAIEPTENFKTQSESISSNQGENFNTILEYIYKHSNNSLFKGIRDEKN